MMATSSRCARRLEVGFSGAAGTGQPEYLANPFTRLRLPKIFNLRMDPYERADITSDQYYDWLVKNAYLTGNATMKARLSWRLSLIIRRASVRRALRRSGSQEGGQGIDESFKKRVSIATPIRKHSDAAVVGSVATTERRGA